LIIRRGPDQPYDLIAPTPFPWRDGGPKTQVRARPCMPLLSRSLWGLPVVHFEQNPTKGHRPRTISSWAAIQSRNTTMSIVPLRNDGVRLLKYIHDIDYSICFSSSADMAKCEATTSSIHLCLRGLARKLMQTMSERKTRDSTNPALPGPGPRLIQE
jgi:hypothetical protein